jgi:hypothetical protein
MDINQQQLMKVIGENLYKARRMAQLNQAQVMKDVWGTDGKNTNRISEIETGAKPVSLTILLKLATLYGTSLDYIFGLSAEPEVDLNSSRAGMVLNGLRSIGLEVMDELSHVLSRTIAKMPRNEAILLVEDSKATMNVYRETLLKDPTFKDRYPELTLQLHRLSTTTRRTEALIARHMQQLELAAEETMARTDKKDNGHLYITDALVPESDNTPATLDLFAER